MISYPIKPWCRVLEAAYKHDFCSGLLTVVILQPHLLIVFPLVKALSAKPGWAGSSGLQGEAQGCPKPSVLQLQPAQDGALNSADYFRICIQAMEVETAPINSISLMHTVIYIISYLHGAAV